MAESFENLVTILRDWAKDKVKKGKKNSCRDIKQVREAGGRKIKPFPF